LKASVSLLLALASSAIAATYTITWSEKGKEDVTQSFQCEDDDYLLDGAEFEGLDWPSASRSGTEAVSAARLISGTVDQSDQSFLTEEQIADGYILTDTAYPRSDCVVVIGVQEELY